MNRRNSKEMHERIIRNFMDLIILKELRNKANIGGYDMIALFQRRFYVLLSAGSLYSMLYAMEGNGLVKGMINDGKKVYKLTGKGEEKLQTFARNLENILSLIRSILDEKSRR